MPGGVGSSADAPGLDIVRGGAGAGSRKDTSYRAPGLGPGCALEPRGELKILTPGPTS